MVRFTRLTLLSFAVILFAGLGVVVFDVQQNQVRHRDEQRRKDVSYILDRIELYAKENNAVPSFPSELQQIGTASENCGLSTNACQVNITSCFSLNNIMNNRELSLPSDVSIGSYYKTGYAVRFDPQKEVVTIVACGTERGEVISDSRELHTLLVPRKARNVQK